MISIVTPAYKAEKYISRCILSVQNQSYKDYEHLIIIQGNVDKTIEICSRYASNDSRIRLFFVNENSNLCINRNTGINNARGDFISFLDADDEYEPFFLSNLLCKILQFNQDIVLGQIVRKGKGWMVMSKPYNFSSEYFDITADFLVEKDVVPFYVGLYRKSLFANF